MIAEKRSPPPKSNNEIYYFDPSIRGEVPPFQNYREALKDTAPYMIGNVSAFTYWNAHPENTDTNKHLKVNAIIDKLIDKLIVNNPTRKAQLDKIFLDTAQYEMPHFLQRLCLHPDTKIAVNQDLLENLIDLASSRGHLDVLEVIYKNGFNIQSADMDTLVSFLKAGLLYNNKDLVIVATKEIENKLKGNTPSNEAEIRQLVAFSKSLNVMDEPTPAKRKSPVVFNKPSGQSDTENLIESSREEKRDITFKKSNPTK